MGRAASSKVTMGSRQVTVNFTAKQLRGIEAIVKDRIKSNPYAKRADVIRELVDLGLERQRELV